MTKLVVTVGGGYSVAKPTSVATGTTTGTEGTTVAAMPGPGAAVVVIPS